MSPFYRRNVLERLRGHLPQVTKSESQDIRDIKPFILLLMGSSKLHSITK